MGHVRFSLHHAVGQTSREGGAGVFIGDMLFDENPAECFVVTGRALMLTVLFVDAVDVANNVGAMEGGELAFLADVTLEPLFLSKRDNKHLSTADSIFSWVNVTINIFQRQIRFFPG